MNITEKQLFEAMDIICKYWFYSVARAGLVNIIATEDNNYCQYLAKHATDYAKAVIPVVCATLGIEEVEDE